MTYNDKPAILGGNKVFNADFKPLNYINVEERDAALRVIDSKNLSGFVANWPEGFLGGPEVLNLEKNWENKFRVKYAVSMNSATSCLMAALGAIEIEPGDEVLVTPVTMTATSAAILIYNAIPVFVDVCPTTMCINPKKIEEKITSKTKAIIGVDIYGQTCDWDEINLIAKKYEIKTIEDAAQSAGGMYNSKPSGTLADIGIFSLNRHKLIQCGEGGLCVTNSKNLAERLRLIRNHAEAIVEKKGEQNLTNLIGFNFRLGEIEAAIANEQLKKIDDILKYRRNISKKIINQFIKFKGITHPFSSPCSSCSSPCSSVYKDNKSKRTFYYVCFIYDKRKVNLSLDIFIDALNKEGIPVEKGGYQPLYYQPTYQKKIAFGNNHFPYISSFNSNIPSYKKGICPIAEKAYEENLFFFPIDEVCPSEEEVALFSDAISKVINNAQKISSIINLKKNN